MESFQLKMMNVRIVLLARMGNVLMDLFVEEAHVRLGTIVKLGSRL